MILQASHSSSWPVKSHWIHWEISWNPIKIPLKSHWILIKSHENPYKFLDKSSMTPTWPRAPCHRWTPAFTPTPWTAGSDSSGRPTAGRCTVGRGTLRRWQLNLQRTGRCPSWKWWFSIVFPYWKWIMVIFHSCSFFKMAIFYRFSIVLSNYQRVIIPVIEKTSKHHPNHGLSLAWVEVGGWASTKNGWCSGPRSNCSCTRG